MAVFHVKVASITKGQSDAGAAGMAQYLARENQNRSSQHAMYLARESYPAKDDLVLSRAINLPPWAESGAHFFAMAERYERKNGVVARTYEIMLPRELSRQGRIELAQDILDTFFRKHPYVMAIHCPRASDGAEQPHVHAMVCERVNDDIPRSPQHFFRRAVPQGQDPAKGGAQKERYWTHPAALRGLRWGVATLSNAALEREGHPVAVSHESLKARGIERNPEVELTNKERWMLSKGMTPPKHQKNLVNREVINAEWREWEEMQNLDEWQAYRQREGFGIGRDEAMTFVRDQFWGKDYAAFKAERQVAAEWKAWDKAFETSGNQAARTRGKRAKTQGPRERGSRKGQHERPPPIDPTARLSTPLIGNTTSKIYHAPGDPNYGDVVPKHQVQFWSHAEAQAAGYRQARNQHYGRGAEETMQRRARGRQAHAEEELGETVDLHQRLEKPLIGNVNSGIYHAPGDPHYGEVGPRNQVKFWSHAEAIAAGYRPARNQHYGRGAEDPMEASAWRESSAQSGTSQDRRRGSRSFWQPGQGQGEEWAGSRIDVVLRSGWDEEAQRETNAGWER